MKRFLLVIIIILIATSNNSAMMPIVVLPDRVNIGTEFTPRRLDLPKVLSIPVGTIKVLDATNDYDYIEVFGELKTDKTINTILKFTTLLVMPGGKLDFNTPCGMNLEIIIKNTPIDTTKDPFQWGNGVLNFGTQSRIGCIKTSFVESVGSLAANATNITLNTSPSGWLVGDELLIPDTFGVVRTTGEPSTESRFKRESLVKISAISGTSLTLSKGLDFAHPTITDPNNTLIFRPRIANLTRNIVIRSEGNVTGHTANIGHAAVWNNRYNQLINLGRTCNQPLDDTILGVKIGACQRGRYSEHDHHVESSPNSSHVGNVYQGNKLAKWGLALHNTSDVLVEGNIGVDFPGAIFVTEDGYEVRDKFIRNFAAYSGGRPDAFVDAANLIRLNCPGCEGTGFWLRGVMNQFEGNEAWNNLAAGLNLMNQQQPVGLYPSIIGGMGDTTLKGNEVPISFTNNIFAVNLVVGLEAWAVRKYPVEFIAAFNTYTQSKYDTSDNIELFFKNAKLFCNPGKGSIGLHSVSAYVRQFEIQGGEIRGCLNGVEGGGSAAGMKFTGTILQNQTNIAEWDNALQYEQIDVMHVPLGNYPHKFIDFGSLPVWNGIDVLPQGRIGFMWRFQRGSQLIVRNWQGTGKDYKLFYKHSIGTNPAWYSAPGMHEGDNPTKDITMQQAWDQYGMSYGGDVIKPAEIVNLDGLVNGVARLGLAVDLKQPRIIITFPTLREPAVVDTNFNVLRFNGVLTGSNENASDIGMVQFDNLPPFTVAPSDGSDSFIGNTSPVGSAALTSGNHKIKSWRTQKFNPTVLLPGSEFYSEYCIGTCDGATPPSSSLNVSGIKRAVLTWSGFTTTNVDIKRNGVLLSTIANSGSLTDDNLIGSSFTYQVCEPSSSNCSPIVNLNF